MPANEKDNLKLTRELYEAYSGGDWSTVRAITADDATLTAMPFNKTYKGSSGVVEYLRNHKTAFGLTVSIQRIIACEDSAVVEYTARGTHNSPYTLPNGEVIQPTKRAVNLPVCHVLRFKNGKISEIHTYFDFASMLTQMGIGLSEDIHRH